jgi:hypothetical protein
MHEFGREREQWWMSPFSFLAIVGIGLGILGELTRERINVWNDLSEAQLKSNRLDHQICKAHHNKPTAPPSR